MTPKEQAKLEIERLVQRFEDHKLDYKQSGYLEDRVRGDFIDKFFEALGWDISNIQNISEAYRDVVTEDKVKVENRLKSPDYSFRQNGKRCFFVEAKKPSVNVKEDPAPAYQVKRYAWSAKLKLSIVTDFEEFAIYDCSSKPKLTDKASIARIDYIKHTEYLSKFDFIWDTFSKEAVMSGGYDKFVNKDKKKGTISVDDDFLESLDLWRTALAKDIFNNNSRLTEEQLNQVVQHTIDRIIFLRIAEDRNIEVYGSIQNCLKDKGSAYKALYKLFLKADDKYNSGLFDFKKYPISKDITVSDKCLSEIIDNLYFPNSPYEFSVIPVEILGSAYEQFLGKTIQIKNGKIHIDEKPEVRKAGGVYYTPQYIVNYIVQNTVGKLIENKTPKEIEKIKVLDPASGSGSFLLGVYDYLLKYHHDWYSNNATKSKGKKCDPLNPDGSLTTDIKKRILLNNIYGVDIDANAVEVTKLSLLLKCLEGETQASIQSQMTLFNERVLPTLDQNIKDGNSLVSTDFFEIETEAEVLKKVKPFNWQIEFKDVFKQGGFDAVISNPPYIKERGSKYIFDPVINTDLGSKYHQGKMDLWYFFMHKSIDILKTDGRLGFITNSYWMKNDGASKLVKRIKDECSIDSIVDFDNFKVFKGVSGRHNVISLLKSKKSDDKTLISIIDRARPEFVNDYPCFYLNKDEIFVNGKVNLFKQKVKFTNTIALGKITKSSIGVQESTDKVTEKHIKNSIGSKFKAGDGVFVLSNREVLNSNFSQVERNLLRPYLNVNNVERYKIKFTNEFLIFSDKVTSKQIKAGNFPNIGQHLDKMSQFITSSNAPYGLHRYRGESFFTEPKIICSGMFDRPRFTYDESGYFCGFSFSVFNENSQKINLKFILSILNSTLGYYWFINNAKKRGVNLDVGIKVFRQFPIINVDFNSTPQKQAHDKIVDYVKKLIELNKSADSDQKQIQHYENQIDKLVYELYGLTEDEIKIIEEATSGNS